MCIRVVRTPVGRVDAPVARRLVRDAFEMTTVGYLHRPPGGRPYAVRVAVAECVDGTVGRCWCCCCWQGNATEGETVEAILLWCRRRRLCDNNMEK